ncbi:DUF1800 domain-containing protein [Massilia forsythiae]|uniref:DUF1800 domain-containing protein n=1 Tax=Massilia forsythiae TaxID=2728020 RepID=A0A7Z2ZSQ5_9BURK|nr:DUF1800 domain-containing protein [Massilia forsythiae]QJE00746.1 DUF1800 domain-containing protein [Massilia forsythiae]
MHRRIPFFLQAGLRVALVLPAALAAAPASSTASSTAAPVSEAAASKAPAPSNAPLTQEQQAVHVLNRLAFGPRPGDVERVERMGVARWIDEQLHPEAIPLPPALTARLEALDSVNRGAGAALGEFLELRKEARNEGSEAKEQRRRRQAQATRQEAEARLLRAIDSPRQLEEVMVDFWYNHFNVFAGKDIDRALVASYERDAIRPYALGSFRNLLGATATHPAMLVYLDNAQSSARGVNENYARELMELHTLGVDGGYSQQDVTELARMLTGWTFERKRLVERGETFRFDARRHDAGSKTWLGQQIAPDGQREGEHALDVLAMHPTTARHVSRQLAQYFVSDDPPQALVERMARTWRETGGDIRSVLRTLFSSAEFMAAGNAGAKFKTPYQFVVSAVRAGAVPVRNVEPLLGALNGLGMPLYGCQTPDGYKNTQEAWLNPDALARRIGFAAALANGKLGLDKAPAAATLVTLVPPAATNAARAMAPTAANPGGGDAADMAASMAPAPKPAAAPAAPIALDPAQLQATLAEAISPHTLDIAGRSPANLRAAMLLGSPDFMQR